MTLTEALLELERAGKIRRAWMAGMRTTRPHWRLYDAGGHLAGAGEPAGFVANFATLESGPFAKPRDPDLTDPATVGCLLALLREASADDHVTTQHPSHNMTDEDWRVWWGGGAGVAGKGPTEGDAIAAALIALAGP